MSMPSLVDGDNLLYRLLTDLIKQGGSNGQWLVDHIVADCSVWFDPAVYTECPILLPWAVRDPKCRGNKLKGLPDEWGVPNHKGYFRDDNSLVKGLVKALRIRGPQNGYMTGRRLGRGWVAAHIWRNNDGDSLASQDPLLYPFVPNLVWLPRQIAKLSDIEDGPVQTALKTISSALYRGSLVSSSRHQIAEQSWEYLPIPPSASTIDESRLSFFDDAATTIKLRKKRTIEVVSALEAISRGEKVSTKIISSRYSSGLSAVAADSRQKLVWELKRHI